MSDSDPRAARDPGLPGAPDSPAVPDVPGGASGVWLAPLLGSVNQGLAGPGTPGPVTAGPPDPPAAGSPAAGTPAAGTRAGGPSSAGEAVGMVLAGLGWLARAETASVPVPVLAGWLRELERAQSMHAAARAAVLAAFAARRGYEDDGQGSPRTWLTWQTRVTRPAANAAVASARRLAEHPAVAGALARGEVSASWGRQICEWTDQFPAEARGDADVILLAAARAARTWTGWPGWPRRSGPGPPARTGTAATGSRTGRCGWAPRWAGPGGCTPT